MKEEKEVKRRKYSPLYKKPSQSQNINLDLVDRTTIGDVKSIRGNDEQETISKNRKKKLIEKSIEDILGVRSSEKNRNQYKVDLELEELKKTLMKMERKNKKLRETNETLRNPHSR